MITINSNEDLIKYTKNGICHIDDDIEIAFDGFRLESDLKCRNIYSKDRRRGIACYDIKCENIICGNINCLNITCGNINCLNITCWDITCGNIDCRDIDYWFSCIAAMSFRCVSVKGRRNNSIHVCLDNEIEYRKQIEEMTIDQVCKELGRDIKIIKGNND